MGRICKRFYFHVSINVLIAALCQGRSETLQGKAGNPQA
jgi:hypothetical protein